MSFSAASKASSRASASSRAPRRGVLDAQLRLLDFDPVPVSSVASSATGGGGASSSKGKSSGSVKSGGATSLKDTSVADAQSLATKPSKALLTPRKGDDSFSPPLTRTRAKRAKSSVGSHTGALEGDHDQCILIGKSFVAINSDKGTDQVCGALCGAKKGFICLKGKQ